MTSEVGVKNIWAELQHEIGEESHKIHKLTIAQERKEIERVENEEKKLTISKRVIKLESELRLRRREMDDAWVRLLELKEKWMKQKRKSNMSVKN